MKRIIICLLFFFALFSHSFFNTLLAGTSFSYLDFDRAMQKDDYQEVIFSHKTEQCSGITSQTLYSFFKTLYERDQIIDLDSSCLRIPKIIHQIWIGNGVPKEFELFRKSWLYYHPDWEYRLWTQHDLDQLALCNKELLYNARNPGELSDMLRYEILYQFGGVYVDMDFECLKPLDILHYMYDFYVGIQPLDSEMVQLGIGIVGSIPGHPLLKRCIEAIGEKLHEKDITIKTGPIHCTKIFFEMADLGDTRDIALPAYYFYPLGCQEYEIKKTEWLKGGAFAVHHWAKSWLYPQFRRKEFQLIQNYKESVA